MKPVAAIVQLHEDKDAKLIGQTYRKGVETYQEAGRMLIKQKQKLGHGKWLPWLKANETVLGFGERTARKLMDWAENPNKKDPWGDDYERNRTAQSDLTDGTPGDDPLYENDGPEPNPYETDSDKDQSEPLPPGKLLKPLPAPKLRPINYVVAYFTEVVVDEVEANLRELMRRKNECSSSENKQVQRAVNAIKRVTSQWKE